MLWRELPMRRNAILMAAVVLMAVVLIAVKPRFKRPEAAAARVNTDPTVILVADLREANEPGDNCAEIIRLVRDAEKSGIRVSELLPNSGSPVLRQHRVTVAPTVLILGKDGREVTRFEGEDGSTVEAIRARLRQMESK